MMIETGRLFNKAESHAFVDAIRKVTFMIAYRIMSNEELIGTLFTNEDRLPAGLWASSSDAVVASYP